MKNAKFHLMAMAGIIASVTLVFYASGRLTDTPPLTSASKQSASQQSPYNIIIQEASWGLNCANRVAQQHARLEKQLARAGADEYESIQKRIDDLGPVPKRNNVLPQIKSYCGSNATCDIAFSHFTLDLKNSPYCNYNLDISYLCHSYDSVKDATIPYGQKKTIDCTIPNSEREKAS